MVTPLAIAGSVISPVGIAANASALQGMFGKKKKSPRPEDFYTPEQLSAQRRLSDFATTGKYGDFQAGQDVGLGYGDYGVTGLEQTGLSSLQNLLQSGIPDQYRMGDTALNDFLTNDPAQIQKQFEPFKAQTERAVRDSQTALKRGAAFGGNLYSTDTVRNLGDIGARANETMMSKLADLTNESLNRKLSAVPLAYQSGRAQEDLAMGRIGASQQYGGLTRQLNDASIKARDAEILRRREELKLPISASETLAGQEGRSFPAIDSPSPYQQVLQQVGQIGGQYLGNELFMSQYNRFRPQSYQQPQPYQPQGMI